MPGLINLKTGNGSFSFVTFDTIRPVDTIYLAAINNNETVV